MPDIVVNDIVPRVQYVASIGQTVFAYPFAIFAPTDINVYQTPAGTPANDATQILTYNVNYTVTNNAAPAVGGVITLMVGAGVGDIITIVRNQPYTFLNNFIDGGPWFASTVNTDFDSGVMLTQQNKMYDRTIGVHYNNSAIINNPTVDNVLPVLPPNTIWMKNNANTAITAVTLTPGGGAPVVLPTVANSLAMFTNTTGTLQSVPASSVDGAGNVTERSLTVTNGVMLALGSYAQFNNQANTFFAAFKAPAALASSQSYDWPLTQAIIPGMVLSSNPPIGGVSSTFWQSTSQVVTGSIPNAAILAMSATPFQLVPAPGANLFLIVKSVYLEVVFNTAAFADGGTIVPQYGNTALGAGPVALTNGSANSFASTFFTTAAANSWQTLYTILNRGPNATATFQNQGIFLSNQTGAFTNSAGGTSTVNFAVEYFTVPMN